jgi:hypothetical protein
MRLDRLLGLAGMQRMIGIEAMNDLDLMACVGQRIRQSCDKDRVAAETPGRVEGRQENEF